MTSIKMLSSKKIAIAGLLAACFTYGCGSGEQSAAQNQEEVQEVVATPASASPEVAAYLSLKDALVGTDASTAKTAASNLASLVDGATQEAAQVIAATDDVEAQRVQFQVISEQMYAKLSAEGTTSTLYKQYCPMAFDDTGAYWLSDKEEIRNPYFGDKMLKCGRVEETLAAAK